MTEFLSALLGGLLALAGVWVQTVTTRAAERRETANVAAAALVRTCGELPMELPSMPTEDEVADVRIVLTIANRFVATANLQASTMEGVSPALARTIREVASTISRQATLMALHRHAGTGSWELPWQTIANHGQALVDVLLDWRIRHNAADVSPDQIERRVAHIFQITTPTSQPGQ